MGKNVADVMWEMLVAAGVRRCYGIVGDALNPVIDALRRNGRIDFVHVRHEEWGVFAANAEARLGQAGADRTPRRGREGSHVQRQAAVAAVEATRHTLSPGGGLPTTVVP